MSNTELDDEGLVIRYAQGDAVAFDQLYRRYELRVWRYLERNVYNVATSNNLLQESWFTLARNSASLESAPRFSARLFTVAHDRMTSSRRTQTAQGRPAVAANRTPADPGQVDGLTQAVRQLPNEQRESYLLQLEGELSIGDIGEITNVTLETVQSRLHLARLTLRELLTGQTAEAALSEDQLSEVDDLYRRLSALDAGRPEEWVRRKVQAYSAQQAAERAVRATVKPKEASGSPAPAPKVDPVLPIAEKESANKPSLRLVAIGVIGAVALVGIIIAVPRLMAPRNTSTSNPSPAAAPQPEKETPPVAAAEVPQASESTASAPTSPPLESSQPTSPTPPAPVTSATSPPPVAQSAAARSIAQKPVVQEPSRPPTPVISTNPAGTPRARETGPQSAPTGSNLAETTAPTPRPAVSADLAPAPQTTSTAPSTNTQVASAPTSTAVPSASQATSTPTSTSASTPASTSGSSPDELCRAAEDGDMRALRAALTGNVDVNARDGHGHTALILAIQQNHLAIVRELMAHGADPKAPDSQGSTPLKVARIRNDAGILVALQDRSIRPQPPAAAPSKTHAASTPVPTQALTPTPPPPPVSSAIATPAAAASTPPDGLCRAAEDGDTRALKAALADNADVNGQDANGHTALILAIQTEHVAIVKELMAHGADPNKADSKGNTPQKVARIRNNLAILVALKGNGAH
jgi:RNA polymerase sigma-70 factor (ECF subfamily)